MDCSVTVGDVHVNRLATELLKFLGRDIRKDQVGNVDVCFYRLVVTVINEP